MKKYLAECIGTAMLVFFGCGAAIMHNMPQVGESFGYLGIAVAFGLILMSMIYAIGDISGCHVNPAVSLAMFILHKLDTKDLFGYIIAQVVGAFAGAGALFIVIGGHPEIGLTNGGFGCNGYGALSNAGISAGAAFFTEIILTFCFILTIIGATSKASNSSTAGLAIGLCLIVVHIVGLPLTGTSVNPARSLAPACFKGGDALSQVWVFILAPLVGGALAAFCSMIFSGDEPDAGDMIAPIPANEPEEAKAE
ncbi:MAG: MIP family channel protein [bacterium]|nr:MIP family channel protein [bacterium]